MTSKQAWFFFYISIHSFLSLIQGRVKVWREKQVNADIPPHRDESQLLLCLFSAGQNLQSAYSLANFIRFRLMNQL